MEPHQEIFNYLSPFLVGLLLSTGIGLILGLEREYNKDTSSSIAGIRTFPIVAILGYLLASLSDNYGVWIIIAAIPALFVFLAFDHFQNTTKTTIGHTTHFALITTFVMGIMVANHLYKESLGTAVIVVTLLALKGKFSTTLNRITEEELFSIIKFFILALLVLPFLPNKDFGPNNILNAYDIGWIVVIVSLINFLGYFSIKFIGSGKGILLTAILGGLISSTAVTWTFASQSKENPSLSNVYASGVIVASSIMFPRLALMAFIFNPDIIYSLWVPFTLMFITSLFFSWWMVRNKTDKKKTHDIKIGNPLNILSALTFGAIFIVILVTVYFARIYLGDKGLYLSAIVSGLADTDAITISMSKLANEIITLKTAALVIVTATLSNSIIKLIISLWKGSKELSKKVSLAYVAVLLVGGLYILINQLNS